MRLRIKGGKPLRGEIAVAADKSMTHRALMFGAIGTGVSTVLAKDAGADNHSTAQCLRAMGVNITDIEGGWRIEGVGLRGLKPSSKELDCGNSGTTMRLLCGILAGAGVRAQLIGDGSLVRRPMGRVCRPLRALGAEIGGRSVDGRELPPLAIAQGDFQGGMQVLEVASAQVKSALLLAGATSGKSVTVREPFVSRDHTERMLAAMGAHLTRTYDSSGHTVTIAANTQLSSLNLQVPGDISSAAFWLAAGLMVPQSDIQIVDVGVNHTRTGMLDVLDSLGARVEISGQRDVAGEPVATLRVRPVALRTPLNEVFQIGGAVIPRLIDELVVMAGLLSQCQGRIVAKDAAELRVKESDRVRETVRLLEAFGIHANERADGFEMTGPQVIKPAHVDVSADHRLALTAAVLALAAPGESILDGFEVADVSYPHFATAITALGGEAWVE